jgi:hypothetical protein
VNSDDSAVAAAAALVVTFAGLLAWKALDVLERALGVPPKRSRLRRRADAGSSAALPDAAAGDTPSSSERLDDTGDGR